MKGFLSFLFISLFLSSSLFAQEVITIREARALPENTQVLIEGVINCPDYGFNNGQFYLQDSTGGINVFYANFGGAVGAIVDYDEADTIRISGRVGVFSDQIQIQPFEVTIIGKGTMVPDPIVITADDLSLDSEFQGMRVEIAGVTLTQATQWPTTPINDGSGTNAEARVDGTDFTIRIDRGESAQDGSPIPDEPFTLRGILGRFRDVVQIYPFYESDVSQPTTTNTFEALKLDNTIKVYPNPVREEITLEVLPQAGLVQQVSVFDIAGKMVARYTELNIKNQTVSLPLPTQVKNGSYILSIWTENGIRSKKLTVAR